jgi:hypothetical protein
MVEKRNLGNTKRNTTLIKKVVYLSKGIDDLESQVVFLLAILSNYMSDTINIIPNNWQYVP